MRNIVLAFLLTLAMTASPVFSAPPVIEAVEARGGAAGWSFSVTLSHPDTGWDHYADGWQILDADGTVLGHRMLAHPHVHEQPFTRSLGGVDIPAGTSLVFIQAHCLVDGWGEQLFEVGLEN